MKFTINWLKEYLDTELEAAVIADRLTMLGLEVDSIKELAVGLEPVVAARIESVSPHPDADRLSVCEVSTGADRYQVVCGASNAKAGMLTALARPGTKLPAGIIVRQATIRGIESAGMLCSEKELGLGDDHSGIIELPTTISLGNSLVETLQLRDTMIEVDLTPNRPDCTSVIGIAREIAGFTGSTLRLPVSGELPPLTGIGLPFNVEVHSSEDCPRYAARLLHKVTVAPSPWWLKKRLLAVGLRPINNVVDITNFVMLETGQPMHAFDFNLLDENRIIVRRADENETITTLDGNRRQLDPEMLLICDANKPVALAGIMGGANSEVSTETKSVLLESACFNPVIIRRTARKLNLGTDASYRFERGVDPEGCQRALERCARLIVEIAGGELVAGGVDRYGGKAARHIIPLRVARANALLGTNLTAAEITAFLQSIELKVTAREGEVLLVEIPGFRVDLEREIDLVEEIARLQGYNDIPSTLPRIPMNFPDQDPSLRLRRQLAGIMTGLGFSEAINYSFISSAHLDMLQLGETDSRRLVVPLRNPLTEEQNVMRSVILPGLLENIRRNQSFQSNDLRLFELGKVFHHQSGQPQPLEKNRLAAVMCGREHPDSPVFYYGTSPVDFFALKGVVETLGRALRLPELTMAASLAANYPFLAPEAVVTIMAGGSELGVIGRVNSKTLKAFGIKQEVFSLDLDLDAMLALDREPIHFAPLPRYPFVKRDLALVVPEQTPAGDILQAIGSMAEKLIEAVELFDIYQGGSIESGHKSVAISITYRAADQTLDDATVNQVHENVIAMVAVKFSGKLRVAN